MAEVRKKKVEDTYGTSKIKVKETKKEKAIKDSKTEKKEKKKDEQIKGEKKNLFVRFRIFCSGVKSEFNKVHWTSKSDMIKYSIASIFFIVFCSLFFYLIEVLFALLQSVFA